ncbi:MAG TPA: phosphopantetheine-binding protein [Chthoniobacter sp.]|jgi:acyl carrier protein
MNELEHTTESVAKRLQLCLPRLAPQLTNPFAPLAELALDSIDTVELLCVIHDEFCVRLTESEFNPRQTVGGLLSLIAREARRI